MTTARTTTKKKTGQTTQRKRRKQRENFSPEQVEELREVTSHLYEAYIVANPTRRWHTAVHEEAQRISRNWNMPRERINRAFSTRFAYKTRKNKKRKPKTRLPSRVKQPANLDVIHVSPEAPTFTLDISCTRLSECIDQARDSMDNLINTAIAIRAQL